MGKEIIERYERTVQGAIIIDIATAKVEDLYDDFDKHSQFLKKDLNQDLVEYIIDSVSEIEPEPFILQFSLQQHPQEEALMRVKNSVRNFFIYLKELEARKLKAMARTSMVLFIIGLLIATLSALFNSSEIVKSTIAAKVLAEGLSIAAWVALWEALATFLIEWVPHRKRQKRYAHISDAKVTFNFLQQEGILPA